MAFSSSLKLPLVGPLFSGHHHHLNFNRKITFSNNHHSFSDRFSLSVSATLKRDNSQLLGGLESQIKNKLEWIAESKESVIPKDFPFQIHENLVESKLYLTRGFEGETINVKVDKFDEIDDSNDFSMVVTISKTTATDAAVAVAVAVADADDGGVYLKLDITVRSDNQMVLDCVTFNHPDFLINKKPYSYVYRYESDVSKGFLKYLKRRGINASAMKFLRQYVDMWGDGDFLQHLHKLKEFVES